MPPGEGRVLVRLQAQCLQARKTCKRKTQVPCHSSLSQLIAMSLGGELPLLSVPFGQKKENWTFCEFWKIMEALFVAEKLGKHRSGMESI